MKVHLKFTFTFVKALWLWKDALIIVFGMKNMYFHFDVRVLYFYFLNHRRLISKSHFDRIVFEQFIIIQNQFKLFKIVNLFKAQIFNIFNLDTFGITVFDSYRSMLFSFRSCFKIGLVSREFYFNMFFLAFFYE